MDNINNILSSIINVEQTLTNTLSSYSKSMNAIISKAALIQQLENTIITYKTFNNIDVPNCLSPNIFYKQEIGNTITNLTLSSIANNSCITFNTGSTFTYDINIPSTWQINKDFDFNPNNSYIIAADNNLVIWSAIKTVTD